MIKRMLDLSTANITETTAEWLNEVGVNGVSPIVVYEKSEYGWIIFVPDVWSTDTKHIPGDLLAVLTYAKALDCEWVMLDQDSPVYRGLPEYDW